MGTRHDVFPTGHEAQGNLRFYLFLDRRDHKKYTMLSNESPGGWAGEYVPKTEDDWAFPKLKPSLNFVQSMKIWILWTKVKRKNGKWKQTQSDPDIIINRQGLYSNYDSEVQEIYKKRQNRRKDRKLS